MKNIKLRVEVLRLMLGMGTSEHHDWAAAIISFFDKNRDHSSNVSKDIIELARMKFVPNSHLIYEFKIASLNPVR